jgi:hypothetical protein
MDLCIHDEFYVKCVNIGLQHNEFKVDIFIWPQPQMFVPKVIILGGDMNFDVRITFIFILGLISQCF